MSTDGIALLTGPDARGRHRRLPREVRTAWQVGNLLGTAAAAAVLAAVFFAPFSPVASGRWGAVVLGVLVTAGLVEALVVIPRRHANYRYALLDDCIVVSRGRTWARTTVFPLHQVLYVETHHGPVLRRLGLAAVRIGTIAEPHTLGPVPTSVAEEFRRAVEARGAPT